MNWTLRLGVSVLACFGAGLLGSIFIEPGALIWYQTLTKPPFTPPGFVFAIAWLTLYICMSFALWLVWEKDDYATEGRGWVPLFFCHLLVNAAWPVFFFGLHSILIAFLDTIILIACAIILIIGACEIDKRAAYLLAPYLLWLLFAAYLNIGIWYLN